jgi:PAS domain S-box-containing protein
MEMADETREKEAETAPEGSAELRRALEFNQSVMANMAEGLYAVDTQGLVTYINPAAERLFGWSGAELLGRKMHDVTHYQHPDGRAFPASECPGLQVLQRGLPILNHEDVFIRKDKTFFPVIYSAAPIRSDSTIIGLVVVFRDVSTRKTAEAEIRRRTNWLERLIETTQDAVISIDRQARIVLFNPGAERIFGYSKAEIQGQKVNVLMAEPYAAEHDSYIERYEKTGEARAIGRIRTVEARRKSGETFPIELSVTKVATVEGEDIQYVAFIRDISEVRRREAWLQGLIETTQDAVLSIDRQGRVVLFNPAAERIFGYTRNEIVGQKVNLLMGEPYATEHDGYIEHYERTGEARAIGRIRTVTAKRKKGELFPIELSVTKIAEDREVQYAAFIRDISEKTRLQVQAVENERLVAIGTTAAKIGHELANPLNGMALTIQLLEQRLSKQPNPVDTQITSTVKRLHTEVSRLSTLLEHFRSLSRREKFDFQRTTLTALVGEAIEIELPRYAESGIQVECSFPANLPTVTVDIDKMKQVIFNLTKNAAEAMAGGGMISIKGSTSDDRVVLEISDTGTGIPPGIDIFEPFFTTKPQGTGIGLSIVKQIVRAHGGSVSYSSEHGKGTTFLIALPKS